MTWTGVLHTSKDVEWEETVLLTTASWLQRDCGGNWLRRFAQHLVGWVGIAALTLTSAQNGELSRQALGCRDRVHGHQS